MKAGRQLWTLAAAGLLALGAVAFAPARALAAPQETEETSEASAPEAEAAPAESAESESSEKSADEAKKASEDGDSEKKDEDEGEAATTEAPTATEGDGESTDASESAEAPADATGESQPDTAATDAAPASESATTESATTGSAKTEATAPPAAEPAATGAEGFETIEATDAGTAESTPAVTPSEGSESEDDLGRAMAGGSLMEAMQSDVPWWKEPWSIQGSLSYQTNAVSDDDPANDMSMRGSLRLNWHAFSGARVFMQMGFEQNFTDQGTGFNADTSSADLVGDNNAIVGGGESGTYFSNMRLGMSYVHELGLDTFFDNAFLAEHPLQFAHSVQFILPTSRESRAQDLYVAPRLSSSVNWNPFMGLNTGVGTLLQYNFHQFAERAGEKAGNNLQFLGMLSADVGWTQNDLYVIPGMATVSFGMFSYWAKNYDSREGFTDPGNQSSLVAQFAADEADLQGGRSVAGLTNQIYGWSFYLSYTPIKYVTASVGFEQNSPVRRGGVADLNPAGYSLRDEIDFVMSVSGRF